MVKNRRVPSQGCKLFLLSLEVTFDRSYQCDWQFTVIKKKNAIVSYQIAQNSREELFSLLSEETVTFIMEVRSC